MTRNKVPKVIDSEVKQSDGYTKIPYQNDTKRRNNPSRSTLILRDPVPKFGNYTSARKLDKSETVTVASLNLDEPNMIKAPTTQSSSRSTNIGDVETKSDFSENFGENIEQDPSSSILDDSQTVDDKMLHNACLHISTSKPINVVDPISSSSNSLVRKLQDVQHSTTSPCRSYNIDLPALGPGAGVRLMSYNEWQNTHHLVKRLTEDTERYKSQLETQHQVNTELKKLLVASLGDTLQERIDKLTRERAEMSQELSKFTERVTRDHENLDKISIQADMWRSKFLASKMMGDELARSKAMYAMKCQEAENALLGLLNERHELRASLLQSHGHLDQIKGAFDPLNKFSSTLPSTNVLDVASMIQQLCQTIKFRLLPPGSSLPATTRVDVMTSDALTRAESFAHEVVSRRVDVSDLHVPLPPSIRRVPSTLKIDRYHPDVKYDNLTYNCCARCHGDIRIM